MTDFTVEIHDSPPGGSAAAFLKGPLQFIVAALLFPFVVLAQGDVPVFLKIAAMVLSWGGITWYVQRYASGSGQRPVFQADRTGFRIRRGRLRPWDAFLGAHIERHYIDRQEVMSFRVQLEGQPFDRATRVGTYQDYSGADHAVQEILAFQRKIEDIRKREAENFALGPAPVVAARAKRSEEPSRMRRLFRRMRHG